jgi:hypothetical protein
MFSGSEGSTRFGGSCNLATVSGSPNRPMMLGWKGAFSAIRRAFSLAAASRARSRCRLILLFLNMATRSLCWWRCHQAPFGFLSPGRRRHPFQIVLQFVSGAARHDSFSLYFKGQRFRGVLLCPPRKTGHLPSPSLLRAGGSSFSAHRSRVCVQACARRAACQPNLFSGFSFPHFASARNIFMTPSREGRASPGSFSLNLAARGSRPPTAGRDAVIHVHVGRRRKCGGQGGRSLLPSAPDF